MSSSFRLNYICNLELVSGSNFRIEKMLEQAQYDKKFWLLIASILLLCITLSFPANAKPSHALTLFGEPKYSSDFTHFDYVNPEAPKGGKVRLHSMSGFDSLNPFILKGLSATGLSYVFETLMTNSLDEPQTYYGLIAESIDIADDKLSVSFVLNPKAKWQDGKPITAEDVVFSFNILKEKGDPQYRLMYKPITKVEKTGNRRVTFHLVDSNNRELPLIVATMPVLPKHYYDIHDFEKSTLEPPLGSGAYHIGKVDAGRSITYLRDKNYWGKDLPVNRGKYNFDEIRYDIYRDETVGLEALKANQYDFREEYIARNWATAYDIDAVKDGRLIKKLIPHKIPRGMQGFAFNTRKSKFSDRRVREAISLTMDFEWMNKTLFYDAYTRNSSFFQNTDFAATGLPSNAEKTLLTPFVSQLPHNLLDTPLTIAKTDGSGDNRTNLLKAQALLDDAGWIIKDGKRTNKITGEVLKLEFMMRQRTFERVIAPMRKGLSRLGIEAKFRLVDDAQYQKRIEQKDFDLISQWWNIGVVFPGNEQRQFWHSSQADIDGSNNLTGIKSPVIDSLIEKLESAQTLAELTPAAHALDRVLLLEHVFIPHWSITAFRSAYWDIFGQPKQMPTYGLGFDNWWIKIDN